MHPHLARNWLIEVCPSTSLQIIVSRYYRDTIIVYISKYFRILLQDITVIQLSYRFQNIVKM